MSHTHLALGRIRQHESSPRGRSGQSIVEFALVLPVFLALLGMTLDFARVYQAWVNLESATRDAAESVATSNKDDPTTTANAATKAKAILDAEYGVSFTVATSFGTCGSPTVVVTYSESTTASGASLSTPLGTALVAACVPFRTLFSYPVLTNNGQWTVSSTKSYSVLQFRGS